MIESRIGGMANPAGFSFNLLPVLVEWTGTALSERLPMDWSREVWIRKYS